MDIRRTLGFVGLCLAWLVAMPPVASAGSIRWWTYDGTVDWRQLDGTQCVGTACTLVDGVLAQDSAVRVAIGYDHAAPEAPDCPGYHPGAVKALAVSFGGQTYHTTGHAWMGAYGFAGGCGPSGVGFELVTPGRYDGVALPGTDGSPNGAYVTGGFAGLWGGDDGWPEALPAVLWYQGPEIWVRDGQWSRRLTFGSRLERRETAVIPEPSLFLLFAMAGAALRLRVRRPPD